MTSKHCPYKDTCCHAGKCRSCAHGWQYERMAHKIADLHAENKRYKQELAQARQTLMSCPGAKEVAS